jgi:hypothetical protein
MFKVTLGAYGYTVIAKGTVLAFVEDLQHEAVSICGPRSSKASVCQSF